jgi:hypothetical protein
MRKESLNKHLLTRIDLSRMGASIGAGLAREYLKGLEMPNYESKEPINLQEAARDLDARLKRRIMRDMRSSPN